MTLPKNKLSVSPSSSESKNVPIKKARVVARPTAPSVRNATAEAQADLGKQPLPVNRDKEVAKADTNEKRIRGSFTLPEAQLVMLTELKARCLRLGINAKKGEVLAAGIELLRGLPEASFEACILPVLRPDRKVKNGKMRSK